MRLVIAQVVLLILCLFSLQASPVLAAGIFDDTLYNKLVGDWQGNLEYFNDTCGAVKSCSFELEFFADRSFIWTVGVGCYNNPVYCMSVGQITNITSDTIYAAYSCRGEHSGPRRCYCSESRELVEFCWKYSKPKVMKLKLALNLNPDTKFGTCPNSVAPACAMVTNGTEHTGMASLDCDNGQCEICKDEITCNGRGTCDGDGECDCYSSFSGAHCDVSACPNYCNRHGICDISKTGTVMGMSILDANKHRGVCRCFTGWVGHDCSQEDIYEGKRKLWEGIIFVGVVSTVTTLIMLYKKISFSSFHHRRTRRSRQRRHRNRVEVEMEEFINPL